SINPKAKAQLSSSAPASTNPPPSTHNPTLSDQSHPHVRSTSSATVSGPSRDVRKNPDLVRINQRTGNAVESTTGPAAMPPPDYIPVRQIQPAKRPIPAARNESRPQTTAAITTTSVYPSRMVSTAGSVAGGGARRINQVPVPVPFMGVGTVQARRPPRPGVPTTTDGLLRSGIGAKASP